MLKAVAFDVDGPWSTSATRSPSRTSGQVGKGGGQVTPVFLDGDEIKVMGERLEERRGRTFKRRDLPQVAAFPMSAC